MLVIPVKTVEFTRLLFEYGAATEKRTVRLLPAVILEFASFCLRLCARLRFTRNQHRLVQPMTAALKTVAGFTFRGG